jgi:hypothetical protein
MRIRKLIAATTLAAGIGGTATVATHLTTIIGSTSTAGAPTSCIKRGVCGTTGTQSPQLTDWSFFDLDG